MKLVNKSYWDRRAGEEERMVAGARSPEARQAHAKLAEAYRARALAGEAAGRDWSGATRH